MSLLGHLVPRIASSGAEPAATQALAYILNAAPGMATAFVDVVGRTGIAPFTPGRIAAEEQQGHDFPDVTIRDADGTVRILVENKFWAGLTDAQPLAYLKELPREGSAALVFVVPHQRMYGLWGELKEKCRDKGVELEDESTTDTIKWGAGRSSDVGDHKLETRPGIVRTGRSRRRAHRSSAGHRSTSRTHRPHERRRVSSIARRRTDRRERGAPHDQLQRLNRGDRRSSRNGWYRTDKGAATLA